MARKLDDDRRRLKDIQSTERKIDVKREILPDYDDYVAGVLAGNAGVQDARRYGNAPASGEFFCVMLE